MPTVVRPLSWAKPCRACRGGGLVPSCGGSCPGNRHVCTAKTCGGCGGSGYLR